MEESENNNESTLNYKSQELHLFSCAKISKYFLIPFIAPFFCMVFNITLSRYLIYNNDKLNKIKFFIYLIINISKLFGGLLYFIIKIENSSEIPKNNIENKNEQNPNEQRPSLLINIFEQLNKNRFVKAIKLISFIALIDSIGVIISMHIIAEKNFDVRFFF